MDTFGRRLEYLIKQSDYKSTARFAKDVGLSSVTLSNIKRGITDTTVSNISAMVKLLRQHGVFVDYDWLMDGEANPELEALKDFKARVKPFSNRMNPQRSLTGFDIHSSNDLMGKLV